MKLKIKNSVIIRELERIKEKLKNVEKDLLLHICLLLDQLKKRKLTLLLGKFPRTMSKSFFQLVEIEELWKCYLKN